MRGIEFVTDVGYGDVLNELFLDISLNDYEFYISEDEILSKLGAPAIPQKADIKFLEKMKMCAPYYVFFINLQAYRKGEIEQKISTYEEFKKSTCQFIILIADGRCFDIYAKDEQLLLQFIRNAIILKGENIKIKTDYDDGRVRMSVC